MLYAAGGSFGVLSPSQGAAEGVRNRDNPPPQPRPVEAHLSAAMSSPLGAPGGRSKLGRAPMGGRGGLACSTPSAIAHRSGPACSMRVGQHKVWAAGAARRQVQCHARTREGETQCSMGNPRFLFTRSPNGRGLAPIIHLSLLCIEHPTSSLFESESYFLLVPVGGHPSCADGLLIIEAQVTSPRSL